MRVSEDIRLADRFASAAEDDWSLQPVINDAAAMQSAATPEPKHTDRNFMLSGCRSHFRNATMIA